MGIRLNNASRNKGISFESPTKASNIIVKRLFPLAYWQKKYRYSVRNVAMVLVAAVALGSSTYAWFVSNNNVKATTANISAQSNASLSTASTEKASTRFEVQNGDLTKYYLKETFHIGTNGTTQGQFKNLRVSEVSVTQSEVTDPSDPGATVAGELKNALRIMVVCEEEVAIYDATGALVTKYQGTMDASATTSIVGLTDAV